MTPEITFTHLSSGGWGVRVPHEIRVREGQRVTVRRKDGSVASEQLGRMLRKDGLGKVYAINRDPTRQLSFIFNPKQKRLGTLVPRD